ncbi:MAG: hypothetical protein U5M53_06980 [Rhodoferax sp.]|nr:hypothetical protein [Rhodoferax sp.]
MFEPGRNTVQGFVAGIQQEIPKAIATTATECCKVDQGIWIRSREDKSYTEQVFLTLRRKHLFNVRLANADVVPQMEKRKVSSPGSLPLRRMLQGLSRNLGQTVAKTNPALNNLSDIAEGAAFDVRLANLDVEAPDEKAEGSSLGSPPLRRMLQSLLRDFGSESQRQIPH